MNQKLGKEQLETVRKLDRDGMWRNVWFFDNVRVAKGFFERFMGLMGKKEIPEGYCLIFGRCSSVHTCFMRCDMDALYVDSSGRILGFETMKPWRVSHAPKGTTQVQELRAGTCKELGIQPGDFVNSWIP